MIRQAIRGIEPLSVAIIDIDRFNNVNDIYGHAAGDRVLVRLASSLRAAYLSEDVIAKWLGDKYVLATSNLKARIVRKRINSAIEIVNTQALESGQEDDP